MPHAVRASTLKRQAIRLAQPSKRLLKSSETGPAAGRRTNPNAIAATKKHTLLLDRLRPEQRRPQRGLRRSGGLLGCGRRRLRRDDLRPFSALDLVLAPPLLHTSRQKRFERSGLAVEAEPHHSLRGASRSLDAVARCGPNGLEIGK